MMQRYAEYKESGVDWLGDIPEHWEVKRLKFLCSIGTGERNTEDKVDDGKYPFFVRSQKPEKINSYSFNGEAILTAGDGAGVGKVYHYVDGKFDYHQRVYKFSSFAEISGKYLFHYISSTFYSVAILGTAKTTVDSLRLPLIQGFGVSFPADISEQTAITVFLDDKTAKIDELVGIKRRQIELLAERKQILIQNAVTKGLNPNATMKDSGIDWIGPIPAHWEVKSLNYIAHLKSGDTISAERFIHDGFPVFGGNGFRGYTDKYTNEGDYVLIGRQGALCGNVNYASGKFFASEHAIVAYPQLPIATRWLGELIRKANFNRLSQSAAQPGISVEVIGKVRFPYAPIIEQHEIANFIDKISQKIDDAITIKQNQITKLNEYKSTLINAAVTGKIKVT